jgi:hypothetical protein
MSKTLSESAAEILKASMNAHKDAAVKLPGEMDDLGGSTNEKPEGDDVGKKAAADGKEAPKPGKSSVAGDTKFGTVKSKGLAKPIIGSASPGYDGGGSGNESTELEGDVIAEDSEEEKTLPVVEAKHKDEDEKEMEMADDEDDKEEDEEEANEAWKKSMLAKHKGSMKEDVDALFNGESLSEEFRTKATTIFEAAVQSRVDSILEDVMAENDKVLTEAVDALKEEIAGQVDEYLNYVVEQWVEDNKVAVETGLRAELVDDFIGGLKNLFAEHYIEIPEEKVDVAEELAARVAELEESVAKSTEETSATIASLTEQLNAAKKNEAIRKICEGLTEVQIEKMKSLAEGVEFTTEGEFDNKLATIRENYFPSKTNVKSEVKALQETAVEEPEVAEVHGMMAHYVKAITKTAPKA